MRATPPPSQTVQGDVDPSTPHFPLPDLFTPGHNHLGQRVIRHLNNREQMNLSEVCRSLHHGVGQHFSLSVNGYLRNIRPSKFRSFVARYDPSFRRLSLSSWDLTTQSNDNVCAIGLTQIMPLQVDTLEFTICLYSSWRAVAHHLEHVPCPPRMLRLTVKRSEEMSDEDFLNFLDQYWSSDTFCDKVSRIQGLHLYFPDGRVSSRVMRKILRPFTRLRKLGIRVPDIAKGIYRALTRDYSQASSYKSTPLLKTNRALVDWRPLLSRLLSNEV
ncbi:hypothetical protein H4R33_001599 [Dimargaris cristalligena]|nr:hypothetical protein H4R33_001599 [Dimargaris cristalligena]